MLLDHPAKLLYGRHNLYVSMRLLCTTYRCIVRIGITAAVVALVQLLIASGALHALVE